MMNCGRANKKIGKKTACTRKKREKKKKKLPELNAVLFINVKNRSFVVYGHITLKTPVLVRSPKLSNVEPG